jgi:hypothetical protein
VDRSQAEALVGLLQGYFPRPELPESTVQLWASELEPFEFEDGRAAAQVIAQTRRFPVLAEVLEATAEARRVRLLGEMPALPQRAWPSEDESMDLGALALREWREARAAAAWEQSEVTT